MCFYSDFAVSIPQGGGSDSNQLHPHDHHLAVKIPDRIYYLVLCQMSYRRQIEVSGIAPLTVCVTHGYSPQVNATGMPAGPHFALLSSQRWNFREALLSYPEPCPSAGRRIPARFIELINVVFYPHFTDTVPTTTISSIDTPSTAARITRLSMVGMEVPWIHL